MRNIQRGYRDYQPILTRLRLERSPDLLVRFVGVRHGPQGARQRGDHRPRQDAVDPDVVRAQLARGALCEAHYARLGGRVPADERLGRTSFFVGRTRK